MLGAEGQMPEATPDRRPPRIEVVAIDDHPTFVRGLATLVSSLAPEIDIVAFSDPLEGLQHVVDHPPQVLLLDLHMPNMSGMEVLKKVRAVAPATNVLLLTVSEDPEHVAEAMRAGARGYLAKDVEAEDLVAAVRAVASGKVVLAGFAADALVDNEGRTMPRLSDAEIHLMRLVSSGRHYGEVARDLAISESTLKRQLLEIQKKLGLNSKLEVIAHLARRGLL